MKNDAGHLTSINHDTCISTLCLKKHTNFEMVQLEIKRIDFDE